MDFIAPMLVLITVALVIGSIARAIVVNRRLRENARTWAELQGRLIDKFGNAPEVVRYLESESSRGLLSGQGAETARPHARILDSIHLGILTAAAGTGFVAGGTMVHDVNVTEVMRVLGILGLLVGLGFLVSAALSWFLMRSWDVLPTRGTDEAG